MTAQVYNTTIQHWPEGYNTWDEIKSAGCVVTFVRACMPQGARQQVRCQWASMWSRHHCFHLPRAADCQLAAWLPKRSAAFIICAANPAA